MKNIIYLSAALLLASCGPAKSICNAEFGQARATITEVANFKHIKKRYIVLSTGDTLRQIPRDHSFKVGDVHNFYFHRTVRRKDCKVLAKQLIQIN